MEKKRVLDANREEFDEKNYKECDELASQRPLLYMEAGNRS